MGDDCYINENVLTSIQAMVTQGQNELLQIIPDLEELKQVVLSLSPHYASGPYSMNGRVFKACWNIISQDLLAAVHAFFYGQMLPKYFTYACLGLLP